MTLETKTHEKALEWIKNNTLSVEGVPGNGIVVTSKKRIIYPEVTGYYIPTLLKWDMKDLALKFAEYLCNIQKEDGSWYDSKDKAPYIFDSAQILKGLVAIRDIYPEADEHIIKGCDWILTNMRENGRLVTPDEESWGGDDTFCSEMIHIYCLEPIRDAGKIFGRNDYLEAVDKILAFYKENYKEKIENFSLLSHFYAYVMEGLYDLGEEKLCRESMERIEKYKTAKGGITGLNDVPWVCSTGIFQLAIVWYKLGEKAKGDELFEYACNLQNASGGWYGSYPENKFKNIFYRGRKKPYYFPEEEISWAVKYFLDARYYKNQLENK